MFYITMKHAFDLFSLFVLAANVFSNIQYSNQKIGLLAFINPTLKCIIVT